MDRMHKSLGTLHQLHAATPDGCSERNFEAGQKTHIDIFTTQPTDQRNLLAPSFLVPAVIEALQSHSRFSSLVQVVPGEADAFCARHLADHGGLVLTSDSDLLVHDLGEEGKVIFFRDVYMQDADSPISCILFDPHTISAKFGLGAHRLLRFAYELYRNSNLTVNNIVRQCFEDNLVVEDWNAFCNQYLHIETIPIPLTAPDRTPLPLANLDPRLSELALQLGNNYSGDDYPRTFLPVLIESPIRANGWEPSTWIRQLAYSLLKRALRARSNCVLEYRKVGDLMSRGKAVAMLSEAEIKSAAMDIALWMSYIKEDIRASGMSPWLVFALKFLVTERTEREGKVSHARKVIEQALVQPVQEPPRKIPWDVIHLAALVQAFYGSLRILQQALSIIPRQSWSSLIPEIIPEELLAELEAFPTLQDFPDVHNIRSFLSRVHEPEIVSIVQHFIDVDQVRADAEAQAQKKRKKTGGSQGGPKPKTPRTEARVGNGRNMFDLLPDGDEGNASNDDDDD